MKVVSDFSHDLKGGIIPELNLEQFSIDDGESVLFYGYGSTVNQRLQEENKHYKRKILLNLWEPTQFFGTPLEGKTNSQQLEYFDEIYTICPYTKQWYEEYFDDKRHKYIFHPYDDRPLIAHNIEKTRDVVWFGGFHGEEHFQFAETMKKFDNIIMSKNKNKFVTNYNVTHKEKLLLASSAKISIIFNQLCLQPMHIDHMKSNIGWEKNRAFNRVCGNRRAPQYKARMSESARARCLMLVVEDHWNICEDHWEIGKDFIYTNLKDLEQDIKEVLTFYDSPYIQEIIQNAYEKSLKHNPEETYKMIKEKRECIANL